MDAVFDPGSENGIDASGYPHSLGSCLVISLMCHVLLVVFATGYGLEGGSVAAGGATQIVAHLQNAEAAQVKAETEMSLQHAPEEPRASPDAMVDSAKQGGSMSAESSQVDGAAYIPVEMLSVKPRFRVTPEEILPPNLGGDEKGRVVIQLLVNADGSVDTVVVEASELSVVGTRRFIQHLGAMRLEPGVLDGKAVKARWRLEFTVQPAAAVQSVP